MTVPAVVVLVEGRSTGWDRRLRSFCHPVCCVCAVRADSAIHWNPTTSGDGRHPTAGSSHQQGTQGSLQQVTGGRVLRPWTRSVVGLAASAAAAAPVWCGRADERLRPGAQQRSAPFWLWCWQLKPFSFYNADKQTNRQTNRQTRLNSEHATPCRRLYSRRG